MRISDWSSDVCSSDLLARLLDLARAVELMALVVVLLVVLAASIMVAFVTRMGLAAHQRSIELLHMIGAQDSYVARQFQNHALRFGLRDRKSTRLNSSH